MACMVCGGQGTCLYCGNIKVDGDSSKVEKDMIDIVFGGGRMAFICLQKGRILVEEILREQIEDLGTLMITQAHETSRFSYPFQVKFGNYEKILKDFVSENKEIGKMLSTPLKLSLDEKSIHKIVAFEILEKKNNVGA